MDKIPVKRWRYPPQSYDTYLGIESADDSLGFQVRAGRVRLMPERRQRKGSLSEALGTRCGVYLGSSSNYQLYLRSFI
jgi:hypothetical protein